MRMTQAKVAAVCCLILVLGLMNTSCFFKDEVSDLRQAVENSTKNIKEGADAIKEGMAAVAKVDPIGLKTVLEKEESLQDYVKRLEKEVEHLRNVSGLVKVDGSNQLIFKFTGMKGRFW